MTNEALLTETMAKPKPRPYWHPRHNVRPLSAAAVHAVDYMDEVTAAEVANQTNDAWRARDLYLSAVAPCPEDWHDFVTEDDASRRPVIMKLGERKFDALADAIRTQYDAHRPKLTRLMQRLSPFAT